MKNDSFVWIHTSNAKEQAKSSKTGHVCAYMCICIRTMMKYNEERAFVTLSCGYAPVWSIAVLPFIEST